MNDNYEHVDSSLIYVMENIPGSGEDTDEFMELMNNFNSQLTGHCRCADKCISATCCCLQRCGGSNYIIDNVTKRYKLSVTKLFETYPLIECNSLCLCSDECGNRLVQKGPIAGLNVKNCTEKGLGLFTKTAIPKGTFICEYAGEVITLSEALKRQQSNNLAGKMNFIYCLNEHCCDKVTQTFIDPSYFGNIGRYMNHSCEPNCHIIPVRVDTAIPNLAIFSGIDILPDEELTFDYSSHSNLTTVVQIDDTNNLKDLSNRKICLCKSSNCKGWLPFDVY